MTNEIKVLENILFRLECDSPISKKYGLELDKSECKILLDYITNLQEENERLKLNQTKKVFDTIGRLIKNSETCSYRYLIYDLLGFQEKDYVDLMSGLSITNMLVDYEDYKQRIDKAIEYIKWNLDKNEELIEYFNYDANFNELLDILRGDE